MQARLSIQKIFGVMKIMKSEDMPIYASRMVKTKPALITFKRKKQQRRILCYSSWFLGAKWVPTIQTEHA